MMFRFLPAMLEHRKRRQVFPRVLLRFLHRLLRPHNHFHHGGQGQCRRPERAPCSEGGRRDKCGNGSGRARDVSHSAAMLCSLKMIFLCRSISVNISRGNCSARPRASSDLALISTCRPRRRAKARARERRTCPCPSPRLPSPRSSQGSVSTQARKPGPPPPRFHLLLQRLLPPSLLSPQGILLAQRPLLPQRLLRSPARHSAPTQRPRLLRESSRSGAEVLTAGGAAQAA